MPRVRQESKENVRPSQLRVILAVGLLVPIGFGGYWSVSQIQGQVALYRARKALDRGEFEDARERLAICLQAWPNRADIHLLAARAARRSKAYDIAEAHLRTSAQLQVASEGVALEWGMLQAQRGELSEVEGYLLGYVEDNHPDRILILEALAIGNFEAHRLDRAQHCLDQWLQRKPDQFSALLLRGRVLELLRRADQARADFQRAFELRSESADARLGLARQLLLAHRAKDAVGHFEWLQSRQPENPEVVVGLARCRHELGQRDEARQLLESLVAQHPRHAPAIGELGKVALASGQLDAAERWLRQAVELVPQDSDWLYVLAQCLHRAGKKEEAQRYLTQLKKIEADMERFQTLTQELTRLPDDPALRYEGGVILLRNGMEEEGLHWLNLVLQADPQHQPTHRALAEYYARIGKARPGSRAPEVERTNWKATHDR